ncbi:MAG TPA: hypothetical protein VF486_09335 [Actinomycetes bacterium]
MPRISYVNPEAVEDPEIRGYLEHARHFTEPELVELGFFVALTLGQQRWIKTLGIGNRELLADSDAGLA